ncbi:hypothetical protein KYC5002_07980 [Archangium violaceum]|uniref:hypothetical protein n=1 Tax=Archangium violaceum TaxID=83451 RepID=UPI002B28DE84|nr:hypothetical protein KYC5002_07980 [Archangium gephyra]
MRLLLGERSQQGADGALELMRSELHLVQPVEEGNRQAQIDGQPECFPRHPRDVLRHEGFQLQGHADQREEQGRRRLQGLFQERLRHQGRPALEVRGFARAEIPEDEDAPVCVQGTLEGFGYREHLTRVPEPGPGCHEAMLVPLAPRREAPLRVGAERVSHQRFQLLTQPQALHIGCAHQ